MSESSADWLERKLENVTGELAAAVRSCMAHAPPTSDMPTRLAAAALAALGRVAGERGDRDVALELLAADAGLTYAFEAAAELEADVLALADRLGIRGELGRRLAEAVGASGKTGGGTGDETGDQAGVASDEPLEKTDEAAGASGGSGERGSTGGPDEAGEQARG